MQQHDFVASEAFFIVLFYNSRPVDRGDAQGAHAPRRSQKGPPDEIVKDFKKMIQE